MLNYSLQYSICNGIFRCFRDKTQTKLLTIKYSEKSLDRDSKLMPYQKYESYTKENFVITCLYIIMKYRPSSINKVYEQLRSVDFDNEVLLFKNQILTYKSFLQKDINLIKENYGNISLDNLMSLYKKNKIMFYTVWFIFKSRDIDIDAYIEKNRINGIYLSYIKQCCKYITFSQVAYDYAKDLINQSSISHKGDFDEIV